MPYIYIKKTFVIFLLSILCLIPFNIVSAEQKEEILAEKKLNFREILEFTFNNNDNLNDEREKEVSTERWEVFKNPGITIYALNVAWIEDEESRHFVSTLESF